MISVGALAHSPPPSLSQSNTDSSLIDVAAAYLAPLSRTNSVRRSYLASQLMATHIGANGVRPPGKNGRKIKKRKHAKKCSFLNGGENGAMLTTYLFRYTSDCTVCSQIFKIFFASGGKGALSPPNQNPADTFASQLMATHERAASIQHTGAALLQRRKAHFLDRQRKENRLKPISSARQLLPLCT